MTVTMSDLHGLARALYAAQHNATVTWVEPDGITPQVGFARRLCRPDGDVIGRDDDVRDQCLEMIFDGAVLRMPVRTFVDLHSQDRLFVMEATS